MKLYNNVDRIFNELREIGKSTSSTLSVEDLTKFDTEGREPNQSGGLAGILKL